MASVRSQIFAAVEDILGEVVEALEWRGLSVNPREPTGEDQMNAILLWHGGDREPAGLTGRVEECWLEFEVGMMVLEDAGYTAECLLDAGFVAISDALLNPSNIQLGGLAIAIQREGMTEPLIGRSAQGARIVGGQSMQFAVQYLTREGDASTAGP